MDLNHTAAPDVLVPIVETADDIKIFISKRKPFLLRGSDVGTCVKKWNSSYLSGVVGSEDVKIHVSDYPLLDFLQKNFIYKTLPFNELIQRASKREQSNGHYFISEKEYYYLRSVGKNIRKDVADIGKQFPELAEDFKFPSFVPKDKVFSSVFRLASKEVTVWTHYDVMDNALVQVTGQKQAVLFPPSDALNLYLNGDKSEVIDIENPDLNKYPKFAQATQYKCTLLPGDVLYIPAFWFHNMKYLDFGIAVNVFWKELDESFYDKKDPYGNKDLLLAQQAFTAVDKALSSLSKLPPGYKEFYCYRLISHIQKKMDSTG